MSLDTGHCHAGDAAITVFLRQGKHAGGSDRVPQPVLVLEQDEASNPGSGDQGQPPPGSSMARCRRIGVRSTSWLPSSLVGYVSRSETAKSGDGNASQASTWPRLPNTPLAMWRRAAKRDGA